MHLYINKIHTTDAMNVYLNMTHLMPQHRLIKKKKKKKKKSFHNHIAQLHIIKVNDVEIRLHLI